MKSGSSVGGILFPGSNWYGSSDLQRMGRKKLKKDIQSANNSKKDVPLLNFTKLASIGSKLYNNKADHKQLNEAELTTHITSKMSNNFKNP